MQRPHSRAGYRMRFASVEDVEGKKKSVEAYVREVIAVQKAGLKAEKGGDLDYPPELTDAFDADVEFEAAFENLTAGKQRGYALHLSGAKQSKTRAARIEKYRRKILDGKGPQDW